MFILKRFELGAEGNGCVRYVEIATQTMNLSNVLTNFNSNLTNSNNTSEPCSDQNISPTTSITPSAPPMAVSPLNMQFDDDPLHVQSSKSSNSKSNNGHCIRTDYINANNRDTDDKAPVAHHISEVHHQSPEVCGGGVVHIGIPETIDDANATDLIVKTDDNDDGVSGGGGKDDDVDDHADGANVDNTILQQQNECPSKISNETPALNIDETVIVTTTTAKTPPSETDPTTDESLDTSKKHTSTDGINGPANNLRV